MGSSFDSWSAVEGAYYMGAGTSWELIWLAVSIGMCVLALIMGSIHELDAYRREQNRNGDN